MPEVRSCTGYKRIFLVRFRPTLRYRIPRDDLFRQVRRMYIWQIRNGYISACRATVRKPGVTGCIPYDFHSKKRLRLHQHKGYHKHRRHIVQGMRPDRPQETQVDPQVNHDATGEERNQVRPCMAKRCTKAKSPAEHHIIGRSHPFLACQKASVVNPYSSPATTIPAGSPHQKECCAPAIAKNRETKKSVSAPNPTATCHRRNESPSRKQHSSKKGATSSTYGNAHHPMPAAATDGFPKNESPCIGLIPVLAM